MKILFLCPSLEPGRDGVGDYTRRLATELCRAGHSCMCLSINDRFFVSEKEQNGDWGEWADNQLSLPHLRISSRLPWRWRRRSIQKVIRSFEPDWVSLQYVAHGYDDKGVPFGLAANLSRLSGGFRWHIMFHETWVDASSGGMKRRALSYLQRRIARSLCRKLPASSVSTSIRLYEGRLRDVGVVAKVIPLLSNIEVADYSTEFRTQLLRSLGESGDKNIKIFVIFGTIREGWDPAPLVSAIQSSQSAGWKDLSVIVSVGRLGKFGETVWSEMCRNSPNTMRFHKAGELTAQEVSRYLQIADFGIAITPLAYLGKSGSYAAMKAHGLPVIVSRIDRPELGFEDPAFSDTKDGTVIRLDAPDAIPRIVSSVKGVVADSGALVASDFAKTLGISSGSMIRECR